ncbi:MAG: hypothetical protein ACW97Z_15820 [Candidatus Hodarchaeales archaeon]|jgi:hypothetical protein
MHIAALNYWMWFTSSGNRSEDFEIEFKLQTPPQKELKRIFHGFENSQSGVLAIGIKDKVIL